MTIGPLTKGARIVAQSKFHICLLGDFTGREHDFEEPGPLVVSANTWDGLFEKLEPSLYMQIELPRVDGIILNLRFTSLRDFTVKGLRSRIPLLVDITALATAINRADANSPLNYRTLMTEHPRLEVIIDLARVSGEDQVIDLLSMVDIGEEEGGLEMPILKKIIATSEYDGSESARALAELDNFVNLILDTVLKNRDFKRLSGLWRGLKQFLPHLRRRDDGPRIELKLISSPNNQLCDAVFLTFIRPEQGEPLPLDLLVCCEPQDLGGRSQHTLLHLGRMADGLSVPFILETAPEIFGCKSWGLVRHVKDISGKLAGPTHIKWRKLREEPGAEWLFLAANPFRIKPNDEDDTDETEPTSPACFLPALIMLEKLADGLWPSEMHGAWGRYEAPGQRLAALNEEQLSDMAFEGYMGVGVSDGGEWLELAGITCFSALKIPARDQANPANILEYTLPYRFYSGCCSRFLAEHDGGDLLADLREFTGVKKEEDLVHEVDEGQHLFRIKAPFTVLGVQPDLILAIDE